MNWRSLECSEELKLNQGDSKHGNKHMIDSARVIFQLLLQIEDFRYRHIKTACSAVVLILDIARILVEVVENCL